eukprot:g8259.t1
MGEMSIDGGFSSARGAAMDEEDEILASNEGSEEDRHFDSIVGALEEAVMDPTFANLQQTFVDEWCGEFEDVEENKLIYTDLFRQYTQLVERHLDGWLRQRIRGFDMEAFMKMVSERQEEVVGDVIDILMAVGDFTEFKGMMVAHRKGRHNGLVVTTTPVAGAAGAAGVPVETMVGHQEQAKRGDDAETTHEASTIIMASSSSTTSSITAAVRLATAAFALTTSNAAVFDVSPDGVPMSLTDALLEAGAGDTIALGDGIYREPIVTMNAGEEGNPLVIEGGRGAVINYFSGDKSIMWSQKVVDIRHSWITLRGFTVDGWLNDIDEEDSFVDKCIWVEGQDKPTTLTYGGREVESSLIGTVIEDMRIQNCGMECIRMRNWVTNSIIRNNDIETCGIYDFRFQFDGKIGEAIYIGTSSNQWTDGEDGCNYNLVTNNRLEPQGNECVDVKEGATMNVIEYNECIDQRDSESGCYDSRGNGNIFRYNTADQCEGAGIRLGGHVIDGFVFGVDNDVYGNVFTNTEAGAIKSRQHPQGIICGNSCSDGDCDISEEGDDEEIEESWDQECPDSLPEVPFIDDMDAPAPATSVPAPTPEVPAPTPDAPATTEAPTMTEAPAPTGSPEDDDAVLPEYEMLGCFADRENGRVMRYKLEDPDLTTESCALECEGYAFFGTQYGDECWCGGNETDHLQHGVSELCDYKCAGDATQTCGGYWSMNVYQYACATTNETEEPAAPMSTTTSSIEEEGSTSTTVTSAGCDGVLSPLGYYCCASSCGTCGGPGCAGRAGGASACCTKDIKAAGEMCETTGGVAPCVVDEYLG